MNSPKAIKRFVVVDFTNLKHIQRLKEEKACTHL